MNYTGESDENAISTLQRHVNIGPRCCYSNINVILIYMVRCQELGLDITKIITPALIKDIKTTRNAFAKQP